MQKVRKTGEQQAGRAQRFGTYMVEVDRIDSRETHLAHDLVNVIVRIAEQHDYVIRADNIPVLAHQLKRQMQVFASDVLAADGGSQELVVTDESALIDIQVT